jgi:hypothetical protein
MAKHFHRLSELTSFSEDEKGLRLGNVQYCTVVLSQ